jgi:hypothetical protein
MPAMAVIPDIHMGTKLNYCAMHANSAARHVDFGAYAAQYLLHSLYVAKREQKQTRDT